MRRHRIFFPPRADIFARLASCSFLARVLILHTTATPWLPLWHQRPWRPPLRLCTLSPARERHLSSGLSAVLSPDLHGFCERSASQVWDMAYDLIQANLESSVPYTPHPGWHLILDGNVYRCHGSGTQMTDRGMDRLFWKKKMALVLCITTVCDLTTEATISQLVD